MHNKEEEKESKTPKWQIWEKNAARSIPPFRNSRNCLVTFSLSNIFQAKMFKNKFVGYFRLNNSNSFFHLPSFFKQIGHSGLFFSLFCLFITVLIQLIENKICQWLDSNLRPLVLEATNAATTNALIYLALRRSVQGLGTCFQILLMSM